MEFDLRTAARRTRTTAAALGVGCVLGAAQAGAADMTLSYQAIVHAPEVHDISVEGLSGRTIGTFEGRRVDHLRDGGDTYYSGTLDLTVP